MADTPTPLADRPMYKLVASRLGCDPIEFIQKRRGNSPPATFVAIRDEMMEIINRGVTNPNDRIYITHEVPRRWLRVHEGSTPQAA
jgi:hypothetical protein